MNTTPTLAFRTRKQRQRSYPLSSSQAETPRTDAFSETVKPGWNDWPDFARTLERELTAINLANGKMLQFIKQLVDDKEIGCICWGKCPTQIQEGYVCNLCKILDDSLPSTLYSRYVNMEKAVKASQSYFRTPSEATLTSAGVLKLCDEALATSPTKTT